MYKKGVGGNVTKSWLAREAGRHKLDGRLLITNPIYPKPARQSYAATCVTDILFPDHYRIVAHARTPLRRTVIEAHTPILAICLHLCVS